MRHLATEGWWRIQLFVLVWANFLFLGVLGVAFGGFWRDINGLWSLVMLWGRTMPYLLIPASLFGFVSAKAWVQQGNSERAATLAVLAGCALGTGLLGLLLR